MDDVDFCREALIEALRVYQLAGEELRLALLAADAGLGLNARVINAIANEEAAREHYREAVRIFRSLSGKNTAAG